MNVSPPLVAPKATRRPGRIRRETLLQALRDILETSDGTGVTLADVASYANIPKSSAYHLYADIDALYMELVGRLDSELQLSIGMPILVPENWMSIIHIVIDRAALFFEQHPAAIRLMLTSCSPAMVKQQSRLADLETAKIIEAHVVSHFVLPEWPDRALTFFYAVEAADLMFSISILRTQTLTSEMITEAKRMACSYLGVYIPPCIPNR